MNVIRPDLYTSASSRARSGNRRGRGRLGLLTANQQVVNLVPKYGIPECRKPLVNLIPSSASTIVTPKATPRRGHGATSSSCRRSSVHGRNTTDSSIGKLTTSASPSDGQEAFTIMAITSGRGDARGEVGLAVMDVQYPHMILSQISDCHSYINTLTKIYTFNPVEILMPDTMCEDTNNLYCTIKSRFKDIAITGIPRLHFIDVIGLERIRTHCAKEFSSVELIVHQKYYALAACAALMKYVEYIQYVQYLPKTMRIEYEVSQNTTMIDIESAQSLELVTTNGGQYNYSLFGALDRCSTPMGRRLLRASILQPPCDIEIINRRHLCIEELISNRSLHSIIHPVVRRLSGANRLLSLAMHTPQADNVLSAERNLNYILLLKNIVEIVPELRATLNTAKATFFRNINSDLTDERFDMMKEKIFDVVHPDARSVMGYTSANMQRCFAIKSGINDMLDVARQTYCELIDDMQTLVSQLGEKYNFPLSLGCNMLLGYHIQMDVQRNHHLKIDDMPKEFIQARKQKNSILMTTEPLVVLSQHCRDACEELHILSDVLLKGVLIEIREHIGCLFRLNDNIAELDLIISLAQISSISDYTMPTFGSKLDVRASKHPVMDILSSECPIPNDVIASISYNFQTITGPNMSGKTIYLKQIVLLHIMAQIGCYVPAAKAQFRIADYIFCRLGVRDDIEYNASTFTLELKEVQYILRSVTSNSLIVLDELCRSTTVEEGSSIAWTICKKLAMTSAFTFHTTHLLYLLKMADLYPNITNYYMDAVPSVTDDQPDSPRLIYTHELKKGISSIEHYGITLARATNFPADIIKSAQKIANQIIEDLKPTVINETETTKNAISRRKKNYEILSMLSDKLEGGGEKNRQEICELVRKIDIGDDQLPNTSQSTTPSAIFPIKKQTPISNVDNDEKIASSLSTQGRKPTKRISTILPNSSPSTSKIQKISSLPHQQSETLFKLPRVPLKNLPIQSQSNFYNQSPNNALGISEKTRNILKNPTTDPNSPLFVPRSETFVKQLECRTFSNQTKVDCLKYYTSNSNSQLQNTIKNNTDEISPMMLDNLLLPRRPTDQQQPELPNENQMHTSFDNNIPQKYNYMRHILKNINYNSNQKVDPTSGNSPIQQQSEFFFSSDPVTRVSNNISSKNHYNTSIDEENFIADQLVSPLSQNSYTNDTSNHCNMTSMALDTSINYISTVSTPSYITLSSDELSMSPRNSQTSIDTSVARMMARQKEAKIFRLIEGSQFDENTFFHSPKCSITLGSSSYHSEDMEDES